MNSVQNSSSKTRKIMMGRSLRRTLGAALWEYVALSGSVAVGALVAVEGVGLGVSSVYCQNQLEISIANRSPLGDDCRQAFIETGGFTSRSSSPSVDDTPDPFTFVDQVDVPTSDMRISNTITLRNFSVPLTATISGTNITGFSVNGGPMDDNSKTVIPGDRISVELESSASPSDLESSVLDVNGVSDAFDVETEGPDPAVFVFRGSTAGFQTHCCSSYTVDWGDGTVETVGGFASHSHTYATPGDYRVEITGDVARYSGVDTNLLRVEDWGDNTIINSLLYFLDDGNDTLQEVAPILPQITSYQESFAGMQTNPVGFENWDTSNVINMRGMFRDTTDFDRDLSLWDTGNVESFRRMFAYAGSFNGNVGTWDTSSATNMRSMFGETTTSIRI